MRIHISHRIPEAVAMLSLFTMLLLFPLVRSALPVFLMPSTPRVLMGLFEIIFVFGVSSSAKVHAPSFSTRTWISWAAILWLLWSALSLVLAEHPASAIVRQSEWYLHLIFGVTLCSFVTADKALAGKIIKAILGGFLIYCCYILYLWHIVYPYQESQNWLLAMPGFNNIRHFGCYAMIAVILSSSPLFNSQNERLMLLFNIPVMALCWGVLIWSGSRGAILAIISSLALLVVFLPPLVIKRLILYQAVSFSAGAYLSNLYHVNLPCFGVGHFLNSLNESTMSGFSSGRTDIWMETIPAVLGHPFFGMGADGFIFVPRSVDPALVHPHNLFLQAAIDWGLPGLLLSCLLLFAAFRYFFVQLRQRNGISAERIVSIWGFTALCLLAMIDGPFYFAHSLALSACLLAIAVQFSPAMSQPPSFTPSPSLLAFVRTSLLAVLVIHLWIVSAQFKVPIPEPTSLLVKLARVLPTDISYSTRWAGKWAESSPEEAIEWLHWGHEHVRFSLKSTFMYEEAGIHIQQKQWREARIHLEEALVLSPSPKLEKRIRQHLNALAQETSSNN